MLSSDARERAVVGRLIRGCGEGSMHATEYITLIQVGIVKVERPCPWHTDSPAEMRCFTLHTVAVEARQLSGTIHHIVTIEKSEGRKPTQMENVHYNCISSSS